MPSIEYGTLSDKEQLKKLYNMCFFGDEEFADWYYENLWQPQCTLVVRSNGEIVSSLQLLPLAFEKDGEHINGCYVFAVCTCPAERGKGYSSKLIEKCFEICHTKGLEFCALIAREASLLDYYGRFGFQPTFKVTENSGYPEKGECSVLDYDSILQIDKIYKDATAGLFCTVRNEEYWKQQMSVYKTYGLKKDGKLVAYCFGDIRDNMFYGAEACGERIEELVKYSAAEEGIDRYKYLSIPQGNAVANGCIKPLSEKMQKVMSNTQTGYLNLYFN